MSLLKKSLDASKTDGHTDRVLCIENHPARTAFCAMRTFLTLKSVKFHDLRRSFAAEPARVRLLRVGRHAAVLGRALPQRRPPPPRRPRLRRRHPLRPKGKGLAHRVLATRQSAPGSKIFTQPIPRARFLDLRLYLRKIPNFALNCLPSLLDRGLLYRDGEDAVRARTAVYLPDMRTVPR